MCEGTNRLCRDFKEIKDYVLLRAKVYNLVNTRHGTKKENINEGLQSEILYIHI